MSSSIRPDEFSKYAPRWVREGLSKPRDAMGLPPAPQLASVQHPQSEPVWRGPSPFEGGASPFEGDVRQWRTRDQRGQMHRDEMHEQYDPDMVAHTPVLVTGHFRVGTAERLIRTAAIVAFAVVAMGALGLVLFPDAPKQVVQNTGSSALTEAAISQRDKHPLVKSTARIGASDQIAQSEPVPAPRDTTTVKTITVTPPAAEAAPTPARVADAVYVVASNNPTVAPPRPAAPQPVDTQSAQPQWPAAPQRVQTVTVTPPAPQPQLQLQPQLQPQAQPVVQPAPQAQQPVPPVAPVQQQVASVQSTPSAAPALPAQRVHSQRILSPDELDRLIHRGEAFLDQGDVAAARLVLERAAEARDPRAALALGSTYDPNVLRRMGVVGVQPDAEKARVWYERAAEFGSGEASQRLTALAQLGR
jgi:hypothetical protein